MIGSHVIPRLYLQQFAAETGRLWVCERGQPPRAGTARSEGRENGYFAYSLPSGEVHERFETELQRIETRADSILTGSTYRCFVWTREYRGRFALYLGMVFARSTKRRAFSAETTRELFSDLYATSQDPNFLNEYADHVAGLGLRVSQSSIKETLSRVAISAQTPQAMARFFLDDLLHLAESIARILQARPAWQVWVAPEGAEFLTSDNPLSTMIPLNDDFAPGFGFNHPTTLAVFPLNPIKCLVIGNAGNEWREVDAETVDKVNANTLLFSTRFVYCRSKPKDVRRITRQFESGTIQYGQNAFLSSQKRPTAKELLFHLAEKLVRRSSEANSGS